MSDPESGAVAKYPNDKRKNLFRSITICLVAAFLLCGVFGVFSIWDMSRPTQIALVMLLVAATMWISEAVPLFVTSFVVLLLGLLWLLPVMRYGGVTVEDTELLAPFFSDVILLFLGGFVLSAALHKYRLDEQLARTMISRTGESVPVLLMGIMVVTAFLSMWLSNTATAAMMLTLCLPIAHRFPKDDPYRKAVLLSVPFAANVGGLGTPIGSPPNAIAMQYMQQDGIAPSFATWVLIGVPGVIGTLIVVWCVLMAFYRGKQKSIVLNEGPLVIQWTPALLTVVGTSLLTVVGWMTSGFHGVSPGTVALLPVVVFFGAKVLKVNDLRAISWDVLLMMGGGLCLGKAIAISGLATWIVERLPVEQSDCFWLLLILAPTACLMSSVMSNTATANLLMPVIMGLSVENPSPVLIGVAFACTLAMPLPVSTPPNAITFSSGELTVWDMLLPGAIVTAIGLLLTLTIGHWWWDFVGLI